MEKGQNSEFSGFPRTNNSNEGAFKRIFELYSGRLFQFANSFLKNRPLSEEVVSDVFFKFWVSQTDISSIDNLKAYLFKATYNTTLNYLDEIHRKKAISLEDLEIELGVDSICPETSLINKELKETIDKAIESLPSRCKLIYKMAKVEQLKYKEIAKLLDVSVKTIDNQLAIATKKIGEIIFKYLEESNTIKDYHILLNLFIAKN